MFKLSLIVVLALALCVVAEPIRQRPLRRRVSARQEALPSPRPTGYAPAGVTPEIPFELPTETEKPVTEAQQPDEVYGPPEAETIKPDEVYGPPETDAQQPDEVYGPPEAETQEPDAVYGPPESEAQQPDEIYGPPETVDVVDNAIETEEEAEEIPADLEQVEEEVAVDENGEVVAARLVFQRRQPVKAAPARLTKAKLIKPANFVYTARFQRFPKN